MHECLRRANPPRPPVTVPLLLSLQQVQLMRYLIPSDEERTQVADLASERRVVQSQSTSHLIDLLYRLERLAG